MHHIKSNFDKFDLLLSYHLFYNVRELLIFQQNIFIFAVSKNDINQAVHTISYYIILNRQSLFVLDIVFYQNIVNYFEDQIIEIHSFQKNL